MRDRRTKEGYRLRIYMDQIKIVEAMSDSEWATQWANYATESSIYISRSDWIVYLNTSIMSEVNSLLRKGAA